MPENHAGHLIGSSKEAYGEAFGAHLLEQYRLYVQSAESVSARRIASTRYLLALSVGLIALHGVLPADFGQWTIFLPALGIVVSLALHHQVAQGSEQPEVPTDP